MDTHIKNIRCQFIVAAAVCTAAMGYAVNLTKPPEGYTAVIDPNSLISRQNNAYPLSDQQNKGNWVLQATDSDEFEGEALNTKRWYPNNPKWKGRPPTYFHGSNVSVNDGELVIKVNQHGDTKLGEGFTHTSGFIKSRKKFLYGYFEAELKCMDAPWVSGFWMCNVGRQWWTEIDICENCPGVVKNRHDLNSNIHVFRAPKDKGNVKKHFSITKKYYFPYELQADYHVWGLEWNPDVIRFYIDGVLFREDENTHWHQPLEVNINCESNEWFGAVPDDSRLDKDYRVKYFRAWKQTESPPTAAKGKPWSKPKH
jgi:beta-glucanase (GH16 family)